MDRLELIESSLDILRCPACGAGLKINESALLTLRCEGKMCMKNYPIVDGVPYFTQGLDGAFDARWKFHPEHQATITPEWLDKIPWKPQELSGLTVLDAGCGVGRFSKLMSDAGARVVGIDLSPHALHAASASVPNGLFIRADLSRQLPLAPKAMDRAVSIGVIHHTAEPEKTFSNIANVTRDRLAIWVYAMPVTDARWVPALQLMHEITKACPADDLYAAIKRWAIAVRQSYNKEWEPLMQILRVSNSLDDAECISDTFDWHAPMYRWWHTVEEVKTWFRQCGFNPSRISSRPVSVEGARLP